jgi:hypothetical protein
LSLGGIDKGGYYHEKFLRDKQFLAKCIHRKEVKSKVPTKTGSSERDINLYAWPYLPTKPANNPGKPPSPADRFERDQLRTNITVSGLADWNLDLLLASPPQQAQEIFQAQHQLSAPRTDTTLVLSMTRQRQQQLMALMRMQQQQLLFLRARFALALEGDGLATGVANPIGLELLLLLNQSTDNRNMMNKPLIGRES